MSKGDRGHDFGIIFWDHTNRALIEYNKVGYESALLTYAVTWMKNII